MQNFYFDIQDAKLHHVYLETLSIRQQWAERPATLSPTPGAAMACNAMCTTSYSSSEFELQSTIAYFFKKLSDFAGNFSTSGYYFNSNLLFFHIKKHIHMCIYIRVFLSKTGKYIFGQEKGQCIIFQNTTNPCKTHSPSALLHVYSSFTWNNIISRTISQYYKVILFPYCLASTQTSFCVWQKLFPSLRYLMQIMDNDHFSFFFLKKCLTILAAQRQILAWLLVEVPHCRFITVWKSTEEINWQLKGEKIPTLFCNSYIKRIL